MTIEKSKVSIVISAVFTLVLLGLAPATAGATELVPPTDEPNQGTTSTPMQVDPTVGENHTGKDSTTSDSSSTDSNTSPEQEQEQTDVKDFKSQGNDYLLHMRDKMKTEHNQNEAQVVANRQKHCEQMQKMLNNQVADFSRNAQNHLDVFNSVYSKVQAFATSKNVTSAQYQSLVTAANTQQANATQAVAALKTVAVNIDCTQQDPASSLATIKSAVDSTRTALQSYQQAIKAVISNLESATKSSSTTNTQQ